MFGNWVWKLPILHGYSEKKFLTVLLQDFRFAAAIYEVGFDTSYTLICVFTCSVYRTNASCNTHRNKNAHLPFFTPLMAAWDWLVLNCFKAVVLHLDWRELLKTCSAVFFQSFFLLWDREYLMVWLRIWIFYPMTLEAKVKVLVNRALF